MTSSLGCGPTLYPFEGLYFNLSSAAVHQKLSPPKSTSLVNVTISPVFIASCYNGRLQGCSFQLKLLHCCFFHCSSDDEVGISLLHRHLFLNTAKLDSTHKIASINKKNKKSGHHIFSSIALTRLQPAEHFRLPEASPERQGVPVPQRRPLLLQRAAGGFPQRLHLLRPLPVHADHPAEAAHHRQGPHQ